MKWQVKSLSHVRLFATPWTVAHQAPQSVGFPRQEYWSGLPCPDPPDLPDPGIKPMSLTSPALAGGFPTWEAPYNIASYSKYMMGQIVPGCFPHFNGHVTAGNVCLQKSLGLWKDSHNTNRNAVSTGVWFKCSREVPRKSVSSKLNKHSFEICDGSFCHVDRLSPTPANRSVFWVYTWICLQVVLYKQQPT